MSKRLIAPVFAGAVLLVVLVGWAVSLAAQPSSGLQGAWQVVETTTTGPKASTDKTQPGLFLFTAKHYSMVRIQSVTARQDFKDPANVTEAEALAVWGPLQAQSGTYEVSGGMLTTNPMVAKNPQVMRAGRKPDVYAFTLQGETLTLVPKSFTGQPVANPTTLRLRRVE
jgi:hypothetical protein